MAGKTIINGRHPMALQAELHKQMGGKPEAPKPTKAAPPPPPPAAKPKAPVAPPPPTTLTSREKLETLPDASLIELAKLNDVSTETTGRTELLDALEEAGVTP